jgi:hypothetical protein
MPINSSQECSELYPKNLQPDQERNRARPAKDGASADDIELEITPTKMKFVSPTGFAHS